MVEGKGRRRGRFQFGLWSDLHRREVLAVSLERIPKLRSSDPYAVELSGGQVVFRTEGRLRVCSSAAITLKIEHLQVGTVRAGLPIIDKRDAEVGIVRTVGWSANPIGRRIAVTLLGETYEVRPRRPFGAEMVRSTDGVPIVHVSARGRASVESDVGLTEGTLAVFAWVSSIVNSSSLLFGFSLP